MDSGTVSFKYIIALGSSIKDVRKIMPILDPPPPTSAKFDLSQAKINTCVRIYQTPLPIKLSPLIPLYFLAF